MEVDGKPVKLLNGTLSLDPGTHVIVVSAPAYVDEGRELRTGAGIREDLRFSLTKATSQGAQLNAATGSSTASARSGRERHAERRRPWTWSLAAGAVAASAVSVGLRLRVNRLHDEFSDCSAQGGSCGAVQQTGQHVLIGSQVTGALAGALALGAVVAFVVEGARRDSLNNTTLLVGPHTLAIGHTF